MTQRERQILKWIEENPLISQQELADKAGIARSSVAVHISNLMKQGHIAGKGYIVRTAPYVVVVGGRQPGHRRAAPRGAGGGGLQPWPGAHEPGGRGAQHRPQHGSDGAGRADAHRLRRRYERPAYRRLLRRAGHRHQPVPHRARRGHLHLSVHHRRARGHGPGGQRHGDL